MMIGLCGCMMQEPEVVEKIRTSYHFVDLVFGTHNIYKFAELIVAAFESKGMIVDIWKDTDKIVEDLPVERKYTFKSGVNIMFDATISAAIVLFRMCAEESAAAIQKTLSVRLNVL